MVAGAEEDLFNVETKCINQLLNERRVCMLSECPELCTTRGEMIWGIRTGLLFVNIG